MPKPLPGLVVHYSYLWSHEDRVGQVEGSKDRPCAVVLVANDLPTPSVVLLGVTHTPPASAAHALELPVLAKRRLGLDDARSWIVTTEANLFTWPGPDLRPRFPDDPGSVAYGFLPDTVTVELRRRFRQNLLARHIRVIRRTE